MNILVIDSSKKRACIQIITAERTVSYTLDETEKHSENLLKRIDELLTRQDLKLADIDTYCAVVGPGSFTGIRVGLSTIKAFNTVFNKKLISINAFEPFLSTARNGVILLSSTHTSFYYAIVKNGAIDKMDVVSIDDIKDLVKGKKVYMLDFEKYAELKDFDINYIDNYNKLLENVVITKQNRGEFVADNKFEPLYIQLSQAELQLKNKK